jgi:RNA polymerase sigma-70 factor, ECF subfamily
LIFFVMQDDSRHDGAFPPRDTRATGQTTLRLLDRARGGDRRALELLYLRCFGPLRRWARGRLPRWARGVADTDDLVQQTLMRSLKGVDSFDPHHSGAFLAYLRQGVLNCLRDEVRRVRREPPEAGTAGEVEDARPSPMDEAIGREVLECYEGAFRRLKPEDQEAIFARVELGLSFPEMAETLGKPSPDAARMATSRALVRLAREMSRE